jgi:hypothetical protein
MGDARRSIPTNAPDFTKASRMTHEVKKLSWFQKHVLCMNVEIHKENYQGYRERKEILDTQREILHKLSGEQGAAPVPSEPIPYRDWNTSRFDWNTFGKQLGLAANIAPSHDDEDEDEATDADEDAQEEEDNDYDDSE